MSISNIQQSQAWSQGQMATSRSKYGDKAESTSSNLNRYVVARTDVGTRQIRSYDGRFFTLDSSHPIIRGRRTEHNNLVDGFMAGRATIGEVESNLRELFQTVLNSNLANGLISGENPDEFLILIRETYHLLRLSLAPRIDQAHHLAGHQIAKQNGLVRSGAGVAISDWVFYNSDFYFFERDLVETLTAVAQEFLEKHGGPDAKIDERGFWHGNNFNTRWNHQSMLAGEHRQRMGRNLSGGMVDARISPPRGFMFFFGELLHYEKIELGHRRYGHTGNSIHKRVMIINKQTVTRDGAFGGDRFNALDFWGNSNIIEEALRDFLGNFEVFHNILHGIRNPSPYSRSVL